MWLSKKSLVFIRGSLKMFSKILQCFGVPLQLTQYTQCLPVTRAYITSFPLTSEQTCAARTQRAKILHDAEVEEITRALTTCCWGFWCPSVPLLQRRNMFQRINDEAKMPWKKIYRASMNLHFLCLDFGPTNLTSEACWGWISGGGSLLLLVLFHGPWSITKTSRQ